MDKIIIDAGIGTITANANGNLLLQQVLEKLKEKIESTNAADVLKLLSEDGIDALKEEKSELEIEVKELEKKLEEKETEISELEDSLEESDEGLTLIDCGYGKIWYKTDNLKLQMYMEDLSEKLETVGV